LKAERLPKLSCGRFSLRRAHSGRIAAAEWRDAIGVVERGEIELECANGECCRFGSGAIVWLAELPLRATRNRGQAPVVLIAVSRRRRSSQRLTRSHLRRILLIS